MALKRLDYIPQALNLANSPNGYAFTEPVTGITIPGGGLNPGDLIRLTLSEATALSTGLGAANALYEGQYQWVQVDSGATAGNVKRGTIACLTTVAKGNAVVTDYAHALANNLIIGVFLNSITPGNWGWIQISGRASVLGAASFTATPAIGDVVVVTTLGVVTDNTQSGTITYALLYQAVGIAETLPATASIFQVKMTIPSAQE